jgi:hypothetical protein
MKIDKTNKVIILSGIVFFGVYLFTFLGDSQEKVLDAIDSDFGRPISEVGDEELVIIEAEELPSSCLERNGWAIALFTFSDSYPENVLVKDGWESLDLNFCQKNSSKRISLLECRGEDEEDGKEIYSIILVFPKFTVMVDWENFPEFIRNFLMSMTFI